VQFVGGTIDNPHWLDYPSQSPTVTSASLAEGVRLSGGGPNGRVFSLMGSEFNPGIEPGFGINRLLITGTATIDENGWADPEYFITTQIQAAVSLSGGLFDPYLIETEFSLLDSAGTFLSGVGSGSPLEAVGPGTHTLDLTAMDVFNEDLPSARLIQWNLRFEFNWTGFSTSDSLTFSIPGQSIDIVTSVPSPSSVLVFATTLAIVAPGRRRRRDDFV
jgi:hypothetical protein